MTENAKEKNEEKTSEIEQKGEEQTAKHTELVETEKYLNTGAHIGTKFKSGEMKRYIYKMRKDGLFVLDVQTIDNKLKAASKMLSGYATEKIAVVARRAYGQTPAKVFAETVGATAFTGRFIPGTFTNPQNTRFFEPKIVVVTDPETDSQAIEEATRIRVPVIAFVSTNNSLKNIDLAIPINNKGKKSLALAFWILAKEILKKKGDIKSDSEMLKKIEDFEYKMKEGEEEEKSHKFGDKKKQFNRQRERKNKQQKKTSKQVIK
jgi:small subunit ribosomal protein S2